MFRIPQDHFPSIKWSVVLSRLVVGRGVINCSGYRAPPSEREKGKKKNPTKTNSPLHPSRPPPKLPKISVVNKSPNEEEAFELRSRVALTLRYSRRYFDYYDLDY